MRINNIQYLDISNIAVIIILIVLLVQFRAHLVVADSRSTVVFQLHINISIVYGMISIFGCLMSDIRVIIALEIIIGIVIGENLVILIILRSSDRLSDIVLAWVLEQTRRNMLIKVRREFRKAQCYRWEHLILLQKLDIFVETNEVFTSFN